MPHFSKWAASLGQPVDVATAVIDRRLRRGWEDPAFAEILRSIILTATHEPITMERLRQVLAGTILGAMSRTGCVGNKHDKLHELARVNLDSSDQSGKFALIPVTLLVHRLERDGSGDLVIRARSGHPPIAGIALSS